jgi:hypothetical protein
MHEMNKTNNSLGKLSNSNAKVETGQEGLLLDE